MSNKKNYWYFIISIILSIVIIIPIIKFFSNESLIVNFVLDNEAADLNYQVFYLDSHDKQFNEDMSVHLELEESNGERYLKTNLPIKELIGLRLDFGENPGDIALKSVEVVGRNNVTIKGNELVTSNINMIDQIEFKSGKISGISNDRDPYIIFPPEMIHSYSHIKYDWLPIISIYILINMLFYYFTRYLLNIKSGSSYVDLIFAVIFFAMLILPVTKINTGDDSNSNENRALAVKPLLIQNGLINSDYGKSFEAWLNDRFRYRQKLINIHNSVEVFLANSIENDKAFVGKDNWLFYKGEGSVELYQNKTLFNDDQLKKIMTNLENRQKWLELQGIEFFVFIIPDKESIYGEYYPTEIKKIKNKNRVQLLIEYLDTNNSSTNVNYLLDPLLGHKDDGILYWKTDTHWNNYGAYVGYLEMMGEITTKSVNIDMLSKDKMHFGTTVQSQGDLTAMLNIKNEELFSETYLVPEPKDGYHFTYVKNEGKNGIITHNPNKKLKVLVFRDSFSTALVPYLSETFADVEYVWSHDFNSYQDKIMKEKPDIVIHELVSRYANYLLNDVPALKEVNK